MGQSLSYDHFRDFIEDSGGIHIRIHIPYPYYGYYNNYVFGSSESAYDQGYRDGLKTGENDARRRQSYDPERSHYFRDAGFGNYSGEYRDGFDRGYQAGYRS